MKGAVIQGEGALQEGLTGKGHQPHTISLKHG